jgi:hypothetical protein
MKERTVDPYFDESAYYTVAREQTTDYTLGDNLSLLFPARANSFTRTAAQETLGSLAVLPVELLHQILAQLDLRTLIDFRYVNRKAAEAVDGLPDYKLVAHYTPNTIHGVLAIGAGRWTTCEDICEALYEEECEVEGCGLFAGYLYLPTCKKVCFECFTEHPQLPATESSTSTTTVWVA